MIKNQSIKITYAFWNLYSPSCSKSSQFCLTKFWGSSTRGWNSSNWNIEELCWEYYAWGSDAGCFSPLCSEWYPFSFLLKATQTDEYQCHAVTLHSNDLFGELASRKWLRIFRLWSSMASVWAKLSNSFFNCAILLTISTFQNPYP